MKFRSTNYECSVLRWCISRVRQFIQSLVYCLYFVSRLLMIAQSYWSAENVSNCVDWYSPFGPCHPSFKVAVTWSLELPYDITILKHNVTINQMCMLCTQIHTHPHISNSHKSHFIWKLQLGLPASWKMITLWHMMSHAE